MGGYFDFLPDAAGQKKRAVLRKDIHIWASTEMFVSAKRTSKLKDSPTTLCNRCEHEYDFDAGAAYKFGSLKGPDRLEFQTGCGPSTKGVQRQEDLIAEQNHLMQVSGNSSKVGVSAAAACQAYYEKRQKERPGGNNMEVEMDHVRKLLEDRDRAATPAIERSGRRRYGYVQMACIFPAFVVMVHEAQIALYRQLAVRPEGLNIDFTGHMLRNFLQTDNLTGEELPKKVLNFFLCARNPFAKHPNLLSTENTPPLSLLEFVTQDENGVNLEGSI